MSGLFVVTDGGDGRARSTLATVRALAAAGHRSLVTVSGRFSLAASSRYCSERVPAPRAEDSGYAESVRRAADSRGAAGIIAASDVSLIALGAPVAELVNKTRLARRANSAGLPTPPTERFESVDLLRERAHDLPYPIVVKPEAYAAPVRRISNPAELLGLILEGPVAVQPYLTGPMQSVAGMIRGGRLTAIVHQRYLRTWPVDCGTSSLAITTTGDPRLEERLVPLLGDYEGVFQAQFRDGQLLDVNPRVYGSLPLAVAAGVNLAALQAELLLGRPASSVVVRARPGVRYRWIEGDVRHVAALVLGGGRALALASLLPRPGTVHSVWHWKDPLPFCIRARMALTKRR